MSKKNKMQKALPKAPVLPAGPLLSCRGKKVIGAGIALAAVGFYLVTLTDPSGQNWASSLCPFLILGGYALMGIGIVTPDPETHDENPALTKP